MIHLDMTEGVPRVDVTVNGKLTEPMVVDSGAAIVSITADFAKRLGITPGKDDPSTKLTTASGEQVDAKIIHLDSVRVGQFTVEDVECAILPAGAKGASACLLGSTFLRHFVYRMDITAGVLHLSQMGGNSPEKAQPRIPATRSNSVSKTEAKAAEEATASGNIFSWRSNGNPKPVRMGADDHIRFLTLIHGLFGSKGDAVGMRVGPAGEWILEGERENDEVEVGAMAIDAPSAGGKMKTTQYSWSTGDPPLRMIDSRKGFCCLAAFGGRTEANDKVGVYIGNDGYWYLGGDLKGYATAIGYELPRAARFELKEFRWSQGESPIRMIKKDEGFCYLAAIGGEFRGGGEQVRVFVSGDGWWYLDGRSGVSGVTATAVAVHLIDR